MSLVKVQTAGRYTNVFVGNYMVVSVDQKENEATVYGVGDKPLETIEVGE